MKKLVLGIISVYALLSSNISTNANEGTIEKILNIPFAVEQIEYKLSVLPERKFKNLSIQKKYNSIRYINKVLIDEFYSKYALGDIDYYTTKGIITNHKLFIHNNQQLFTHIERKLQTPNSITVDQNIIDSYSEMRINLNRIKYLYSIPKRNTRIIEPIDKVDYEVNYEIEYNGHHTPDNNYQNNLENHYYNNEGA